jgi:hypothetical protein
MMLREKWPVIGRHEQAAVWLQIWTDLGRAPRTIDAYARGLAASRSGSTSAGSPVSMFTRSVA